MNENPKLRDQTVLRSLAKVRVAIINRERPNMLRATANILPALTQSRVSSKGVEAKHLSTAAVL